MSNYGYSSSYIDESNNTTITTNHQFLFCNANALDAIADESIALVVTSPPYPMIAMWDDIFGLQNPEISKSFAENRAEQAYELMHVELDKVWKELYRVMIPGGFVCINIGDATRTINKKFQLYPNHSRIIQSFLALGMVNLPNIIWRKQTNAPNKFMGSGMLPSGAYVTLEHEWILVFRKGNKRIFKSEEEKQKRRKSAFFWAERNRWFSDLWDLKGTGQKLKSQAGRERSAAYPLEVPHRLINMYSLHGDTVLDPFLGTGTTTLASIVNGRNSIGVEIDRSFEPIIRQSVLDVDLDDINAINTRRLAEQKEFVLNREQSKGPLKYQNQNLGVKVMTSQEKEMMLYHIDKIDSEPEAIVASYRTI